MDTSMDPNCSAAVTPDQLNLKPIGILKTVFKYKNGTPRQPTVCLHARGVLTIDNSVFNNPQHSLEGLEQFSHIWVIFVFHKNNNECSKAKIKPPRLNGKKTGLFSTRCPYRPSPIGLTLAKIDHIEAATIHLSGIDIIDGTPVLDIKPYIPEYDQPNIDTYSLLHAEVETSSEIESKPSTETECSTDSVTTAQWLNETSSSLRVEFTSRAKSQLQLFSPHSDDSDYKLEHLCNVSEARRAIIEVLAADPRSVYRRKSCPDSLYYFTVDRMHITCWFDHTVVEVLRVQPIAKSILGDDH